MNFVYYVIKDYTEVEKPKGEAIFYMENDRDNTIWAIYPCGICEFLANNNSGEWVWYRGSRDYARTMSAEPVAR